MSHTFLGPVSIHRLRRGGFTIIELLLSMAVLGIVLAFSSQLVQFNVTHVTLDTLTQQMIGDIKNQQYSAISGKTSQGLYLDFSIRFEEHRYILYPGLVYSENNPLNVVVPLEDGYVCSQISFPSSELSFSRLSGDVRSFVSGQNSFKLVFSQTNETRTVTINKRGVISVQ